MPSWTQPDRRLQNLAHTLTTLAHTVPNVIAHIRDELANADGYPHGGSSDGGSRSTNTTSTVEAAVLGPRHALSNRIEQINDDIDALIGIVNHLNIECRTAVSERLQAPPPSTCTADPGVAGYLVPLDEGGWHDPLCGKVSRTSAGGLCSACRMRLQRWRRAHDLKPLDDDHQPIQVETRIGVDGVAHTHTTKGAA